MTLRVTNRSERESFLRHVFANREGMADIQRQIATGSRVNSPSDDPSRAGIIEQYRNQLQRIERHTQRIAYAQNFLDQQESTVSQASDILVRAKEIATQGANEAIGADLRDELAVEVFQLRDALVNLANTKVQGRYVYGNLDDDDPPFDAATYAQPAAPDPASQRYIFDAEVGTGTQRTVNVSDFTNIQITSSGGAVFSNAISALERLGRALQGYRTTPEDGSTLPTGAGAPFDLPNELGQQTDAIRAAIDLIENARNNDLENERVSLGGRQARVQVEDEILKTLKLDVEKSRSTIQDTDIYDAATKLTQYENNLQATLASGVRIQSLSLLDFL